MPTPVNSARQCLAGDAAAALDEAVAAARRRVHAQTTSLHVVFALLSSSSPASSSAPVSPLLRDAVSRARSSAYSPRLQFKALELCFGVALDRLPSSHHHHHQRPPPPAADDPPVSNSLMAAIKRSQAHQRRNPDTFHLYHQSTTTSPSSSSSSSFTGVKVELQQLVLAILDDPVVSRVFGDAGFRSCDIKLAVLRPPPPILRFPRASRCPPLFLCNFSAAGDDLPAAPRGFPFPFPGQLCSDGGDENCRRIAEVLARHTGRNPVLVGVGAAEAARDFARAIEQRNWSVLPPELRGLKFASIEKEVLDLSADNCDRLSIRKRLEELGRHAERPGVIVSIGDLKSLVEGDGRCADAASCLVSELTRVLELQRGSLWVMARSATYETYMKFLSWYPLLDKDWDLQLLPITSLRPAMGGLLPKPHRVKKLKWHVKVKRCISKTVKILCCLEFPTESYDSLMETFVPFGGFLPAAYELKGLSSKSYQSAVLCQHCNDKYEQEVAAFLKGCSPSIEDQHQPNMPLWMRKVDTVGMNNGLDSTKAKDDRSILSAKVMELQKKWNDNCQRLHQGCQLLETDNHQKLSHVVSLPYISDKEKASNQISKNPDVPQDQSLCGNAFPMAVCLPKITKASQSISMPIISEPKDKDLISKLQVRLSKSEQFQTEGFWSRQGVLSELGIQDGHASPSSITSVTTDLVLGSHHEPSSKEEKLAFHTHMERLEDFSGCSPSSKADVFSRSAPEVLVQSYPHSVHQDSLLKDKDLPMQTLPVSKVSSDGVSSYNRRCLSSNMCKTFDPGSFKTFYTSFIEKVTWQEEAIRAITDVVVRCKTGLERHRGASPKGDIWFSFLGPDRVGKKRAAMALAELIFGSREYLICINLGYQDSLSRPHTICDQQFLNEYDVRFRGKTIVDHIAEEVGKNPWSVILLENIDKADYLVQSSLSQAIQTGKISNSHGREFSINNAIFVLTAETIPGKNLPLGKECSNFSEERVLGAQGWQMKLLLGSASEDAGNSRSIDVSVTSKQEPWNRQAASCSIYASKRKADISHHHQEQNQYLGTSKRAHKRSNTLLDLNLPVEEVVASGTDCSSSDESNSMSDNSEAWIEDLFNLMDETVNFKPFDFDALADYVLKEINKSLRNAIGCCCTLEIDVQVMEQMLAAIWLLENKGEINNWLEQVLTRSLIESRRRFNLSNHTVLKLVACEGAPMDRAPGILLPSRIIVE